MPSPPRSFDTSFEEEHLYFYPAPSTSAEEYGDHLASPSKSSLRIGVIILSQDQTQLLDFAALDLLAMIGRSGITRLNPSTATLDEAVDEVDIRYVTGGGEGSFPVTSGSRIPVTVSLSSGC
jgi:hypothetical protein